MAEKYFNQMKNTEYVVSLDGQDPKERVLNILKSIPDALKLLKESFNYFRPINKAIYVERKQKQPTEDDIYICECIPSSIATEEMLLNNELSFDCKEKCINRMISTECEVNTCPCGVNCHNRQFQLQQDRAIYPFKAGAKGWGLRAGEFIPKGEIYSIKSSYGQQKLVKYSKNTCTYLMKLSAKEVIDPTEKGNIARFINHSCDPNCRTEKWNILGEIGVGIVAFKDIEPGAELTFDYQFDVYKTPLMRCLCGAVNCKGYLGLVPLDYTQEEWETKLENMPCEICASNYDNDDDTLILCDGCNLGFHIDCLTPKLDMVPQGDWYCPNCADKNKKLDSSFSQDQNKEKKSLLNVRSKKKAQFEEISEEICAQFEVWLSESDVLMKLKQKEFLLQLKEQDISKKHRYLLSSLELNIFKRRVNKIIPADARISIFWHNSDTSYRNIFNRKIELTIIGTEFQINFISSIINQIQKLTQIYKENSGNIIKQFKIPAIFLKRVLGEYYCNLKNVEKKYNVKIQFNRNHVTDDCYPIHFLTTIFLNGKNQNILKAHQHIKEILTPLVARRIYMRRNDIKIIIGKLGLIKKKINPTEIRCCRDNALRDINHPFYTIYYKNKEVTYVGTNEEVRKAEQTVAEIIQRNQDLIDNTISLNYLIPVCNKGILLDIKAQAERVFPGNKMIVYDPLYPRKKVSITLTSSYKNYNDYFKYIRKKLDDARLFPKNFLVYQTQMLYEISKYFFKYLQNYIQTKSMVFMKHWDSISAEFDDQSMTYQSSMKILFDEVSQDYEFLFYILRVNNLYTKEKMKIFDIGIKKFLDIIKYTLKTKNNYLSLNYSVLKDPVSDKLPEDYEDLVEKERFSYVQSQTLNNYQKDTNPNYFQRNYPANNQYRSKNYDTKYSPRGQYYQRQNYYDQEYGIRKYPYIRNEIECKTKERYYPKKSPTHSYKRQSKTSKRSLSSSLSSSEYSRQRKHFNFQDNSEFLKKDRDMQEGRRFRDKYENKINDERYPQNNEFTKNFRKQGKREFQSSRYYKTSIDSKSENEDIYSKERKIRKQRLGSSISLEESDKYEQTKNSKEYYERKPRRFGNFQENNSYKRSPKNFYDEKNAKLNYGRYSRQGNYDEFGNEGRFYDRR